MRKFYAGFLLILIGNCFTAAAQDTIKTPHTGGDTISIVNLVHSDRLRFKKVDSLTQLQIVAGHVELQQDKTLFYCDSAVINKYLNTMEAFGRIHINDADSIHIYSEYLIYDIKNKLAILKKKVKLTDGNGTLTTDELHYDTKSKLGTYTTGGKIVNGKTTITSKEAVYYGDLKDVYFKRDVKMRDPQYDLDTDSLIYNTQSQLVTFITKTYIKDSTGGTVVTSDGFYDMKNKIARFGKRPIIKDGKGVTITGEEVLTNDSTGETIIKGNGVYKDSAQKISVIANHMIADKKNKTFLATQHPLMIIEQDKDSIYVSADTLFSARVSDIRDPHYHELQRDTIKNVTVVNAKDSSEPRYFQCYHHVRIFSDSLQAVCDSMFYSATDSVFRLYTNPIVWASQSQITGDTIYLYTRNKKAERMYVFENSFAINKSGENMFNQVSGKTLNGYFKDGEITFMRTKGSPAQSIYYAKDENDAMVGVNNAVGDIIDMQFEDKALKKVIFRNDVSGTMYPMNQIPEEKKTLRNFKWLEEKRPKTKFELFEDLNL